MYSESFQNKKAAAEANPTTFSLSYAPPDHPYNAPFSIAELLKALDSAKGNSCGPDQVGYPMLKKLPLLAKQKLLEGYNQLWADGSYPNEWRCSTVIPIPKAGSSSKSTKDFRPISLSSCTAKVMERMVNRRLMTYLESNKLLDKRQHAFRKGRGTSSYLTDLGTILDKALQDDLHADIATLDLSKAYNRVWREGVLRQIKQWGLEGCLPLFIQSFLSKRSFKVAVGNQTSRSFEEETGVPQGSVLAVSLFLIAMQSLFTCLPKDVYIFVYADDIVLVVVGGNATRVRIKLQAAVRAVSRWADSHGFQMSPEKCSISHVCSHGHVPWSRPVTVDGNRVPYQKVTKILGVSIDRTLSFNHHFQRVRNEVEQRARLIRIISGKHSVNNRQTILNVGGSLITSKLLYGVEITCRNIKQLVKCFGPVYNKMIRNASGLLPSSPTMSICVEAGQLPFELLITKVIAKRAVFYAERFSSNSLTLLASTAKQQLRHSVGIRLPKVSKLLRLDDRRWDAAVPQIDWELKRKLSSTDPPAKAQAEFRYLEERKYSAYTKLYTDGSKGHGKVGAGVYGEGVATSHRLPNHCSVYSAEIYALTEAIEIASQLETPVVIFTDSASFLQNLEKGQSHHPWMQALDLVDLNNITFCWVPAHKGIFGNEEADTLAKRGREDRIKRVKLPGDDARKHISSSVQLAWDTKWWNNNQPFLRKIKGTTEMWKDRQQRSEQVILSRLRIGHTRFTHSHFIGEISEPPKCTACDCRLTVEHILVNCPLYNDPRNSTHLSGSVREILNNEQTAETALLEFLRKSQLYEKI